jgi:hypothetical protein
MVKSRDDIRKDIFGNSGMALKKEVVINEDITLKVKAPTLKEVAEIRKKVNESEKKVNESETPDLAYMVWSVILFTYIKDEHGQEKRLFDKSDYETIINKPDDGLIEKIFLAIADIDSKGFDAEKKS